MRHVRAEVASQARRLRTPHRRIVRQLLRRTSTRPLGHIHGGGAVRGETDGPRDRHRPIRSLPTGIARRHRQVVASATKQPASSTNVCLRNRAAPAVGRRRGVTPQLVERDQPPLPSAGQRTRRRFHGQSRLGTSCRDLRAPRALRACGPLRRPRSDGAKSPAPHGRPVRVGHGAGAEWPRTWS